MQQMCIFSCFRFELSFLIITKQIAVQCENARSSTSPTSNCCGAGSNGQREQTFPKASRLYRELGFLEYLHHDIRQTKKGKVYTNPFHRTTARRKGRDHSLETEPVHLGFMTIVFLFAFVFRVNLRNSVVNYIFAV